MQGPHHVAQKFKNIYLPLKSFKDNFLLSIVIRVKSGADSLSSFSALPMPAKAEITKIINTTGIVINLRFIPSSPLFSPPYL